MQSLAGSDSAQVDGNNSSTTFKSSIARSNVATGRTVFGTRNSVLIRVAKQPPPASSSQNRRHAPP